MWVALHAVQYGLAISGLNGIRSVVVCTAEQPRGGGWLSPCVQMTVSRRCKHEESGGEALVLKRSPLAGPLFFACSTIQY